jgi:hypothetical protein
LFESDTGFAIIVILLFISLTAYLHGAFLTISSRLTDRFPKYLDYAVAILAALGLVQAFTLWPKLKDFYSYNEAGEEQIANELRKSASDEKTNCGGRDKEFYTPFYCTFLDEALTAPNLVEFALNGIVGNKQLLSNEEVTTYTFTSTETEYDSSTRMYVQRPVENKLVTVKHSPLLNIADDLKTYHDRRVRFEATKFSATKTVAYDIAGMMAFLLAASLRILKTSLELFGGLKSSKSASST